MAFGKLFIEDEGAAAFVGENFGEDAVRELVADDVNALDAVFQCGANGFGFGEHSGRDCSALMQLIELGKGELGDQRVLILGITQNASGSCDQDELGCAEGEGDLGGDIIGIDIEDLAF